MPKKQRNRLGQFISSCSMDKNPLFLNGATNQKIPSFLMVIIFIILASPWLTIFFKSKKIRAFLNLIIEFYNNHFIAEADESNGFKSSKKGHGDI